VARNAEVEDHALDRREAVLGGNLVQLAEVGLNEDRWRVEPTQKRLGTGDGDWIAIEREQPPSRPDSFQQGAGVSSPAQRAVNEDRARTGLKELYYLL
jgi:hypothetical protein